MVKAELECEHVAPVKPGTGATLCPVCGEIRLVRALVA